ncbi:thiol reductant ABC exporter subunit CydC [Loigolactobacillus bifermentans]|uniref:Cytochrome D ABC transporter, ATP-binding and permease protein n=1 Tax=Loigolactobacillus bifermentans DSM 20003 TaxID=1423726 RepID=A0A0R1GPS8_9LACO|nr:thiol reductant ABC exporter subunit CydC [Loigolactobacillus bifermentans]KRK32887.1 cytochrome D ABC transporter, ATP-binding and permease protein [Loigolactobacillus bifermentans DSM 20003]QGG61592.1 thiol reductant ABC exporter subunit CydC [Loigolactobacillus bifermentans]
MWQQETWLKPYLKKYWRLLVLTLTLGGLTLICGSALMVTSGYLISLAARQPASILVIYVPVVLTRAFGIGRPVLHYLERLTSHNWVLKVTSDLRKRLFQHVARQVTFAGTQLETGRVLSLLADDIDHLQNLYLRALFPTVLSWGLALLVTIALGYFNGWLGLFMLVVLSLLVVWLPLLALQRLTFYFEQQKQLRRQQYTDLTDAVLGLADWVGTTQQNRFIQQAMRPFGKLQASRRRIQNLDHTRDFWLQLISGGVLVVLLLWLVGQAQQQAVWANWAAGFALGLLPLLDVFVAISQSFETLPLYLDAVKHLNQLPAAPANQFAQQTIPVTQPHTLALQQVTFRYSKAPQPIFQKLQLTIQPGEKLAILGKSGIGKTTLLQLLLGDLTPEAGAVTLDQVPIQALHDQRSQLVSVLDQTSFLFNTTIRNNLSLGNLKATEADLWRVLTAVQLAEMIKALPEGLDTSVTEAGARFSGGEQQRLVLARVLLQDTPIVVLDEPTVGLDPLTEQALLTLVFDLLTDKTVIWVTHHLQGVAAMDQVVFLQAGGIRLQGAPQQLYQDSAFFRKLYQLDQGLSLENTPIN